MATRAQKFRLGVFMFVGVTLLLGGTAVLAGLQFWNPKDRYSVHFGESVSGLDVGSTVKMKGVRVGQVEKIRIAGGDVESVVVTLALTPGTPVKVDTEAVITAIGITGLKEIELTGGSKGSARRRPNRETSIIPAGESTLRTLTGKATTIAEKMEGVLNNLLEITLEGNQLRIRRLLENASDLAAAWAKIAGGRNARRIQRILNNVDRSSVALQGATATLAEVTKESGHKVTSFLATAESAARSLDRAVRGLRPQQTLTAISRAAQSLQKRVDDPGIRLAFASMGKATSRLADAAADIRRVVNRRDQQLSRLLSELNQAARYLKSFARSIEDRPSLLLRGTTHEERKVP